MVTAWMGPAAAFFCLQDGGFSLSNAVGLTNHGPCRRGLSGSSTNSRCLRSACLTLCRKLGGQLGAVQVLAHTPVMPTAINLSVPFWGLMPLLQKSLWLSTVKWDLSNSFHAWRNRLASCPMPALALSSCTPGFARWQTAGTCVSCSSSKAIISSSQVAHCCGWRSSAHSTWSSIPTSCAARVRLPPYPSCWSSSATSWYLRALHGWGW